MGDLLRAGLGEMMQRNRATPRVHRSLSEPPRKRPDLANVEETSCTLGGHSAHDDFKLVNKHTAIHQMIIDETWHSPWSIKPIIEVTGSIDERIQVILWWHPQINATESGIVRPHKTHTSIAVFYGDERVGPTAIDNLKAALQVAVGEAYVFGVRMFGASETRSFTLTKPPWARSLNFGLASPWLEITHIMMEVAEGFAKKAEWIDQWQCRRRREAHVSWTS